MVEPAAEQGTRRMGWGKLALLWAATILLFVSAAGGTIVGFSPFLKRDLRGALPEWSVMPFVLTIFFGPGLLAAGLALRLQYRVWRRAGAEPGPGAMFLIVVLTLASVCFGVIAAVYMAPD